MRGSLRKAVLAAAVFLATLGVAAAQEQQEQEQQVIVGVWDVSITGVSCTTGAALATSRAMVMFNDGGTVTDVTVNSNVSTGLGTWRYLGGRSYSSFTKFIVYSEFGPNTFNGTETLTRQIEFKNADEYTVTATGRVYDPDGNLTNTVCATATATRVKQQETAGP
jgi:hypothetical protein